LRTDRDARSGPARSEATPRDRGGPASDPLVGRVLERRYEITRRIARGGMASVYEAHDQRLDRTVAVKVMHPGLGDEEAFAARFVREARAAAKLSHPNVVSVFDQGDDDGVVFLAMELVSGHTLRDTITRESPMKPVRALGLLEPVLGALAAAHRAGLVHRDVKPENVLISTASSSPGAGQVKVADFGLARAVTAETNHTSSGVLIGTVSYIAPELVIEGKADARADVYSVGVMLYELLTGEKPHAGETPIQVAYKHVHDDVPAPSAAVPGIPPYVDALVARATARDRDLRPSDAGVLLHQVRRVRSALLDGLEDDPELTADLALPLKTASATEPTTEETLPERSAYPGDDEVTAPLRRPAPAPEPRPSPAPARTVAQPAPVAAPRRRRPWKRVLVTLLVLALLAGGGVGGWWLLEGRYTRTPALVGLKQPAAAAELEQLGLGIEVARAFSDTVPQGQIISSDPARGDKVLDGGQVTVTISKGVEEYSVPRLTKVPLVEAVQQLEDLKMSVPEPQRRWSETVPEGRVIRTLPAAGKVLRPGTEVTVVVSKGRKPIEVTNWEGKNGSEAARSMRKLGLKVETDRQYSDTVEAGGVISQSPDNGTLYRGDTIELLVSRGPELVTVPDVEGQGVDAATTALEDVGFQVDVEHYMPYFGLGYVMEQEAKGERVPKGSEITIWVS